MECLDQCAAGGSFRLFCGDSSSYIGIEENCGSERKKKNYSPGSPGTVERGCICPEAENNFGRGRSKNGLIEASFSADAECPIHGFEVILSVKWDESELDV